MCSVTCMACGNSGSLCLCYLLVFLLSPLELIYLDAQSMQQIVYYQAIKHYIKYLWKTSFSSTNPVPNVSLVDRVVSFCPSYLEEKYSRMQATPNSNTLYKKKRTFILPSASIYLYPISGATRDPEAQGKNTHKRITALEEWLVISTESLWESIFTGGLQLRYIFPFESLHSSSWQLLLLFETALHLVLNLY